VVEVAASVLAAAQSAPDRESAWLRGLDVLSGVSRVNAAQVAAMVAASQWRPSLQQSDPTTTPGESTRLMLATLTATVTTEPGLLAELRAEVAADPAALDALLRACLVLLDVAGDGDPLQALRLLALAHALTGPGGPS
jgi:hypothetical protein